MDSRNPRKQDNGKRRVPWDLRLHHTSPNPRDYSQNDRDDRHRSYRTGFFSNDRADRQMSSKTGGDRWRDKPRSLLESPTRPKYDSFDSNLNNKNNNDQKFLINHECLEKCSIGVEFNMTSDKDKIVWQTKEQMDLYGLVGGGQGRNEDQFTGQIYGSLPRHERGCRPPGSWSSQSRDKCRTRSLSRQSRDETKKPLQGILKRSSSRPTDRRRSRSRSVCFSQNNTFFEFEHDAEMDKVSKNDMEIDNKKYDISEEKSESIIASGKSNIMCEPMCFKTNKKEVLVNDLANNTVQIPVMISEEAIICQPNSKKKDVITPLNLDNEDGVSFPPNLVNEEAFICSQTLDSEPLLKLNKKDKIVNAKHQRKFHGFDEKDITDDLGRLEMRTLLIQMQNKYEEDCQEFAENAYDVIVESTLGDRNLKSHGSSQVEVLNETTTTILENNLSDSFQNYLIPIEDMFEDDTGRIVDENEPFMKYQDEEFNRETNLALTNMLTLFHSNDKSSHTRPPANTDRHEPVQTDSNSEDKGQFEQTQPIQLDQQQLTQETTIDQSFLEQNSTDSVSQRPTENETLKTDEDNCIGVLTKDVNVKENESDIVNHCLKKLHFYNLDKKTAYFKMKPVRICVEKIGLSKGYKKRLLSNSLKLKGKPFKRENPQVGALENAPTHLRKLRNSVQCSVCGTRVPAASTDLQKTIEAVSSWQCQDCTICVVCFVRDDRDTQQLEDGDPQLYKDRGGRLLVCSKCGLHYHKACIHLEEDQVGSWYVCQFCSTEKKN